VVTVLQLNWRDKSHLQSLTEDTQLLSSLSFCTWYVIANTVTGYRINTRVSRKPVYNAHKGSKDTHMRGMSKYLEAEREADEYKAAQGLECGAETAKQCSMG